MPTDRIAFCYHFKLGNKIVETGVTNDPDRRVYELRQKPGWEKGHIIEVSNRIPVPTAVAWLREQMAAGKPVEAEWVDAINAHDAKQAAAA